MTDSQKDNDRDWIESIAGLAGKLGFNPIQVRWKLERLRLKWQGARRQTRQQVDHIRYRHRVCPACGRVNDRADRTCSGCGESLMGRVWEVLQRTGLSLPEVLSVTSLLGVALVVIYARMVIAESPGGGLWSFRIETLFRFGGHWPPAVAAGEWWRLGTSIFLHAGIWHIAFNLLALSQIGPPIEDLFGRGRMLLFFALCGVVANLGSELWGLQGIAIGASGAIMGLCGLAAGWGQRDGTTIGKQVRNRMLKWGLYTLVFGAVIGADNAAHLAGFLCGGAIGLVVRPDTLRKSRYTSVRILQTLVGAGFAVGMIILAATRPPSRLPEDFRVHDGTWVESDNPYQKLRAVCRLEERGEHDFATKLYVRLYSAPQYSTGVTPTDMVRAACQHLQKAQDLCIRFRQQGVDAIFPDKTMLGDENQQKEVERFYRGYCSWILD